MKLKKKRLFECSISIPAIENDKEGLLVGGFSGISVIDGFPSINKDCLNAPCDNGNCVNYVCYNDSCDNKPCGNSASGTPTPTPTSAGAVPAGLLFGF